MGFYAQLWAGADYSDDCIVPGQRHVYSVEVLNVGDCDVNCEGFTILGRCFGRLSAHGCPLSHDRADGEKRDQAKRENQDD